MGDTVPELKSEVMPGTGLSPSASYLGKVQDDFLSILCKALMGESVSNITMGKKKAGCMGVVLILLLVSAVVLFGI